MNWDQIQGNWKQVAGKVRETWGKITDDDFERIAGQARSADRRHSATLWRRDGRSRKASSPLRGDVPLRPSQSWCPIAVASGHPFDQ